MKSLQNNTLKVDWPMVATFTKDKYLCPKATKEMSEERLPTEPETEEMMLKPYTMEEIDAMLEESERDFEAGRVYTSEEVIKMCMEGTLL